MFYCDRTFIHGQPANVKVTMIHFLTMFFNLLST